MRRGWSFREAIIALNSKTIVVGGLPSQDQEADSVVDPRAKREQLELFRKC